MYYTYIHNACTHNMYHYKYTRTTYNLVDKIYPFAIENFEEIPMHAFNVDIYEVYARECLYIALVVWQRYNLFWSQDWTTHRLTYKGTLKLLNTFTQRIIDMYGMHQKNLVLRWCEKNAYKCSKTHKGRSKHDKQLNIGAGDVIITSSLVESIIMWSQFYHRWYGHH